MSLYSVVAGSTAYVGDPTPDLPILRSLNEVRQAAIRVEARGDRLYIRYSLGPMADGLLGPSANQNSGRIEAGLAFNEVRSDDAANGIRDYAYVLWQKPQTLPWLATGFEVGRGSDGDPLLARVAPVAWLHLRVVVEALCRADGDALLRRMGDIQAQRRGLPENCRVELRPGVAPTLR